MATCKLDSLIDMARYPLDAPASQPYRAAVSEARASLREDGCAVIRRMLRDDAVALLSAEISARRHKTHFSTEAINPYFHTRPDTNFPARSPVNTFIERSSGFIPGDAWEPGCAMDSLFRAPELAAFLARCLEVPELHCYADPLAGLTANILDPGQQFTWHFDTNDFAVTVLVDEADDGGRFEYVPGIRSATDECFDDVQAVLEGRRERVVSLELRPGDLQIFRGRYALHRVTRIGESSRPRHAAIFAYTEKPGVIGRVERTRQLFGRITSEHIAAERERVRSDELLD